jgi:hypothetical protein
MAKQLLLVDYENVQAVDLSKLDEHWRIIIFVGVSQKSVPITLVTTAQRLGSRVEWQRLEASGRNALDFFIAYQLGRELTTALDCTILSKDKGFDPLIRHLCNGGFRCQRIENLAQLEPVVAPNAAPKKAKPKAKSKAASPAASSLPEQCARVIEVLKKSEKKDRPRKTRALSQFIDSVFQKKIDKHAIKAIIDQLLADKHIAATNGVISYEF